MLIPLKGITIIPIINVVNVRNRCRSIRIRTTDVGSHIVKCIIITMTVSISNNRIRNITRNIVNLVVIRSSCSRRMCRVCINRRIHIIIIFSY